MRKIYLLSSLLLGSLAAQAQFTLTTAGHGLVTPNTITYHNFSGSVAPGAGGAGVTWDYSTKTFDLSNSIVETYALPQTRHTNDFPRTNLMMYTNLGDTTFFRQTSGASVDSTLLIGFNFTSQNVGKLSFNDPNLILKFPYDYSMPSFTDMVSGNNVTGNSSTDIDGYGTLKLTSGSYAAIRTLYNLDLSVTVSGFPFPIAVNIKDWTWFIQGQRNPVMKIRAMNVTGFGSDTVAMANQLYTGISKQNNLSGAFNLYPNPATDEAKIIMNLEKSGNTMIEIYAATGALVYSQNMGVLSIGTHTFDLNTANVADGIYTVRLISSGETGIKKLVVH